MEIDINIKQVISVIRSVVKGGGVPMIWGPPGIGKSKGMEFCCELLCADLELKGVFEYGDKKENPQEYFGFFDVRATDKDPVDMGGLPDKDPVTNTMIRLVPDWFPHVGRTDLPDHGVLFIDEAPSAAPAVQVTCYQITQERRIGAYKLKPGWHVAMAGNRTTDGGVSFKMPTPLANRLTHVNAKSDSQYWLNDVCGAIGIEPIIQAFIRFRPDLLNTFSKHIENGRKEMAFATERSWHKLSSILQASPEIYEDGMLSVIAAGQVGTAAAIEFGGFVKVWQSMPSINDIIAKPSTAPVDFDAATTYAVITALAHRAEGKTFEPIMEYLARLSPEYTVAGIKTVHARDNGRRIYATPAFIDWSQKNSHLL